MFQVFKIVGITFKNTRILNSYKLRKEVISKFTYTYKSYYNLKNINRKDQLNRLIISIRLIIWGGFYD